MPHLDDSHDGVDPCFHALLADHRNHLRPPRPNTLMTSYREILNGAIAGGVPAQLTSIEAHCAPSTTGKVPLRLYRPFSDTILRPAILFLHGGGFVIGSLDSHDALCRELAQRSGTVVVAVDYRLAPETIFPGALEDCCAALAWLHDTAEALGVDASRLAICGDSAGGNLAIGTALWATKQGITLRHVGLIYPALDPGCNSASAHGLGNGFILTRAFMQWFWSAYLGESGDPLDPRVAVANADLAGLPPISLSTAEYDPLRDEGEAFARAARAAGVDVTARRYLGMIHGFVSMTAATPMAARAIADIAADIVHGFAA